MMALFKFVTILLLYCDYTAYCYPAAPQAAHSAVSVGRLKEKIKPSDFVDGVKEHTSTTGPFHIDILLDINNEESEEETATVLPTKTSLVENNFDESGDENTQEIFLKKLSSYYPSLPLNKRFPQLIWQALLLVDDLPQTHSDDILRRIVPKHIFESRDFNRCDKGYVSDKRGRCNKMIELSEDERSAHLTEQLNKKFNFFNFEGMEQNFSPRDSVDSVVDQLSTSGPFHVNIPLDINNEESEEQTVPVSSTKTSFENSFDKVDDENTQGTFFKNYYYPELPLNERFLELVWQAWLLVDGHNQDSRQTNPEEVLRKRIVPKNIFIVQNFSRCGEGYVTDNTGRCNKQVEQDEDRRSEFLTTKLNEHVPVASEPPTTLSDSEETTTMAEDSSTITKLFTTTESYVSTGSENARKGTTDLDAISSINKLFSATSDLMNTSYGEINKLITQIESSTSDLVRFPDEPKVQTPLFSSTQKLPESDFSFQMQTPSSTEEIPITYDDSNHFPAFDFPKLTNSFSEVAYVNYGNGAQRQFTPTSNHLNFNQRSRHKSKNIFHLPSVRLVQFSKIS